MRKTLTVAAMSAALLAGAAAPAFAADPQPTGPFGDIIYSTGSGERPPLDFGDTYAGDPNADGQPIEPGSIADGMSNE